MELRLTLARSDVVLQEPVPFVATFLPGPEPVVMPMEPFSVDFMRLRLYDASFGVIAEANDYTRQMRMGAEAPMETPDEVPLGESEPDASIEVEDDLLRYLDIREPGQYFVQARFRFRDIAADSGIVPLRVRPIALRRFDVVLDRIAMAVVHVAQLHEHDGERMLIEQFRSALDPNGIWNAVALPVDAGADVRISVGSFETRKTYDHDFRRWLVWLRGATLTMAAVRKTVECTMAWTLPTSDATLIGRPLQHEDGGLSVHLLAGRRLARLEFDSDGRERGSRVVGELDADVTDTRAVHHRGDAMEIVSATAASRFPLTLHRAGAAMAAEVLPDPGALDPEHRIVALRAGADAVHAAVAWPQDDETVFCALRFVLATRRWERRTVRLHALAGDVDLLTDHAGALHCAIATADGVLHLTADKRRVLSVPGSQLRLVALRDTTWLFYADPVSGAHAVPVG
jgi:hypothetical protein